MRFVVESWQNVKKIQGVIIFLKDTVDRNQYSLRRNTTSFIVLAWKEATHLQWEVYENFILIIRPSDFHRENQQREVITLVFLSRLEALTRAAFAVCLSFSCLSLQMTPNMERNYTRWGRTRGKAQTNLNTSWLKAQKAFGEKGGCGSNGSWMPYFRGNFYRGQEKHLSDSSHTSRKGFHALRMSFCKHRRACGHKRKGGDELWFGLIPYLTVQMCCTKDSMKNNRGIWNLFSPLGTSGRLKSRFS